MLCYFKKKSNKVIKRALAMTVILFAALYFVISSNFNLSFAVNSPKKINVKNIFCNVSHVDARNHLNQVEGMKMIYFVTPTYPRPEQIPELMRLSHTLMHVPRIHWIVAEDNPSCSKPVLDVLERSGLPYTHISSPKPYVYSASSYPRGVANRLAALDWLRDNVRDGILYFGDDDNTFDLQLFDEIRQTKRVSMLPVGFIGKFGVSSPIVNNGKVIGFLDSWPASRKFAVDMAGFAVNMHYLTANATMPYIVGYEEDHFLRSLNIELDDIEPLAGNCTKVLVWHTRTTKNPIASLKVEIHSNHSKFQNFGTLIEELTRLGIATIDPAHGIRVFVTLRY